MKRTPWSGKALRGFPLWLGLVILVAAGADTQAAARGPGSATASRSSAKTTSHKVKATLLKHLAKRARTLGARVDAASERITERGQRLRAKRGLSAPLGWALEKAGGAVRGVAGTETLLNTSVEFGIGGGIGLPFLANAVNTAGAVSVWSGSIAYHEKGIRDIIFNPRGSLNTPNFTLDYSRLGKQGGSISPLPFISGFKDTRSYGVYLGIAGFCELGIGEVGCGVNQQGQKVPARGPFIDINLGLPLPWLASFLPISSLMAWIPERWRMGLYGSLNFTLYSPALRLFTKPMERPATWLDQKGKAFGHRVRSIAQKAKATWLRKFGRDLVEQPQGGVTAPKGSSGRNESPER